MIVYLSVSRIFFFSHVGPHLPLQVPDVGHISMCCNDCHLFHH